MLLAMTAEVGTCGSGCSTAVPTIGEIFELQDHRLHLKQYRKLGTQGPSKNCKRSVYLIK